MKRPDSGLGLARPVLGHGGCARIAHVAAKSDAVSNTVRAFQAVDARGLNAQPRVMSLDAMGADAEERPASQLPTYLDLEPDVKAGLHDAAPGSGLYSCAPKEPLIMRTVRQQPVLSSLKPNSGSTVRRNTLLEQNSRAASFCP
jgi:hypothetical protein